VLTPAPDLLVTGDGRHLAVRGADGRFALLRPKARDFVRDMLSEAAGVEAELADLDALPGAACTADACLATIARDGRSWRIFATRSAYLAPIEAMNRACAGADVAISDRRLPRSCRPRWMKLDKPVLARTGGVSIRFGEVPKVLVTKSPQDEHPWIAVEKRP